MSREEYGAIPRSRHHNPKILNNSKTRALSTTSWILSTIGTAVKESTKKAHTCKLTVWIHIEGFVRSNPNFKAVIEGNKFKFVI